MKYRSMKIENFRKFHNINFTFGQRITVISGENGIGKSSLLSLIASTTGTNSRDQPRRLNGIAFRPEFSELFKISEKEDYKSYRLFIDYDQMINTQYYLTKRIGFNDYTAANRGIRPLPRTSIPIDSQTDVTQKQAIEDAKEAFDITDSKRIQVPTIYLSLSRLLPLGETELKSTQVAKNNNIF
ncbi:ATP-binding protein [Amylolactobacillus amylophilus]|nr:ATP-binding protein [Amylolactobacillus amylophilus]